jgi:hypothetical protein
MTRQLTEQQEIILYRIAIRQDEQGRQSSLIRKAALEASVLYRDLLDLEYLVYQESGQGDDAIASLIVSNKGLRYCYDNLSRLSALDRESRPQF